MLPISIDIDEQKVTDKDMRRNQRESLQHLKDKESATHDRIDSLREELKAHAKSTDEKLEEIMRPLPPR